MAVVPPGSPVSNTDTHTKAPENRCTTHRTETSATPPVVCDDGTAYRENDNYKAPLPLVDIPLATVPTQGTYINADKLNEIRRRLDDDGLLAHWDLLPTGEADKGPGDKAEVAYYDAIVNKLNEITGAGGKASEGTHYNFDLENITPDLPNAAVKGNKILPADWNNLVNRVNTIKNSCVCHMDCSCNWVCGAYQNCQCNSYLNSGYGNCTYTDVIDDTTPDDRLTP